MDFTISGNLVDVHSKSIYGAKVEVSEGRIVSIEKISGPATEHFILPGFIDAHVHIGSSMLIPSEFARLAVVHGTVATVSDPHEIANVCGMEGIDYMISNGKTVPFKFNFGAPSCVPATKFETAGAEIDSEGVFQLLKRKDIKYLSETMNFPGVLHDDEEVMKKIRYAKEMGKPIDGHAPGLGGKDAIRYIEAGITTDHECFTAEEALHKLQHGMKVIIREGSAAKNFDALISLLSSFPEKIMFCSDDKHPDSLVAGHINSLCARAVQKGVDVFHILQAACVNPVLQYKLDVGLLRVGDAADFILVNNLETFEVVQTYINGILVAKEGKSILKPFNQNDSRVNQFNCLTKHKDAFTIAANDSGTLTVIEALDGQLITNKVRMQMKVDNGKFVSDPLNDILKMVVVNRYEEAQPAVCFVKNFGLKKGAIASSVAHDSHNIVAVGVDDESIAEAVNLIINHQGGISAVGDQNLILPLPVAGLMSDGDGYEVADQYSNIDRAAKGLGSTLSAPFMTLSFMALLVIPHLKLSDKGMFDGDEFRLMEMEES